MLIKKIFTILFLTCFVSAFSQEICNNAIDDDGDGLIDLNDTTDCYCNSGSTITMPPSLIPNPSFESISYCPTAESQLDGATGWIQATDGTSDYLNTCGYVFNAASINGLIPFPDGNGIAGTIFSQDWKEYLGTCLLSPLTAGTSYQYSFNIASTPVTSLGDTCSSGGIYYSPVDITIYGAPNCNNLPVLGTGSGTAFGCPTTLDANWTVLGTVNYTPTANWSVINITFTPSININSIILGPPCTLPVSYPFVDSTTCFPYFYFDGLVLNNSSLFKIISITSTGNYCTNDIKLTAIVNSTVTAGATFQWYLNGIAIIGATGSTYNVPAGTPGIGNYEVRIIDGSTCAISDKYSVIATTSNISLNSSTICLGDSVTLSASGNCVNYTWSNTSTTTSSIVVTPSTTTTYSVVGSLGTCSVQATATVSIIPQFLSVSGNTQICASNLAVLTASGAATYTWMPGTQSANMMVDNPASTTTYTVIGYDGLCYNVITTTINVSSFPVLIVNSPTICSGQTATLTANGATTYTWSTNQTSSVISISPITSTVISVTGANNQCVTTASSTISVLPAPIVTVNSPSICSGQTTTLTASGATNYTWSTGATSASITISPTSSTITSVTSAINQCSTTANSSITVIPTPTVVSNTSANTGCAPFCTNFTNFVTPSASTISYNFGDGVTTNTNNPSHCYTSIGNYTVIVTATNSTLGCTANFSLPVINVQSNPVADFTIANENNITVDTDVNFTNTSSNANSYLWNVLCNNQTSISTDLNTTFSDTGHCCIILTASTNSGCIDTTEKCISIIKKSSISIPNVFTPNGDGVNEVFKINSNGLKNLNCTVFNRWGIKMYEWSDINGGWDGKTNTGDKASDGTYFYIVNYTDETNNTFIEKGFFNLFRN